LQLQDERGRGARTHRREVASVAVGSVRRRCSQVGVRAVASRPRHRRLILPRKNTRVGSCVEIPGCVELGGGISRDGPGKNSKIPEK
jgi:hypothetical protein